MIIRSSSFLLKYIFIMEITSSNDKYWLLYRFYITFYGDRSYALTFSYRWRKTGSYKFGEAPTRTMADVFRSGRSGMAGAFRSGRSGMADIFRPRRSSMLIDDNTYDSESTSMKDTAAAAKDTAAAAKDTAAAAKAREADAEDPFGEEEKGVFVEEKMGAFDEEKGAFGEEKTAEDTV